MLIFFSRVLFVGSLSPLCSVSVLSFKWCVDVVSDFSVSMPCLVHVFVLEERLTLKKELKDLKEELKLCSPVVPCTLFFFFFGGGGGVMGSLIK